MVLAPLPVATLIAMPVWRRREMILGNIAGSVVILGTAFALIMRESVALDAARQACFDAGSILCAPTPNAFARYAIYASIGMLHVMVLFFASLRVERRIREQAYAPE